MEELKDELGKLRNEMKIGFIEVDNQFQMVNDKLSDVSQEVKKTQSQMAKIATLVDQGFDVIQTHVDQKAKQQDLRLSKVEERLDRAGL